MINEKPLFTIGNQIVQNHKNNIVYKDLPAFEVDELPFDSMEEIMDAKILYKTKSRTASITNGSDPYKITDAFLGKYADTAKNMITEIRTARQTRDKSLAAAIITSKD